MEVHINLILRLNARHLHLKCAAVTYKKFMNCIEKLTDYKICGMKTHYVWYVEIDVLTTQVSIVDLRSGYAN